MFQTRRYQQIHTKTSNRAVECQQERHNTLNIKIKKGNVRLFSGNITVTKGMAEDIEVFKQDFQPRTLLRRPQVSCSL